MARTFDTIIRGAICVTESRQGEADVGIRNGRIAAIGDLSLADAGETIKVRGLHVLPGVIDTQVHFREPGLTHKEDLESGSRAAVAGGVVAVFEMPNTSPPTTGEAALADKLERAHHRMFCDHAFYIGATPENVTDLAELERLPGACGVKVFVGSSTGTLLVADDETLERVLASGSRRVAIHSEDEFRLIERREIAEQGDVHDHPVWRDVEVAMRATKRVIALARKTGRPVHILHVTTAEEIDFLEGCKDIASVELPPQHLTLAAPECYDRLGTLAQMNPPIRGTRHQEGLWRAITEGIADIIGSDHAAHTLEEKAKPYPASPSGMPGVQTLLPLMLHHMAQGRLDIHRLVSLTSAGAHRLFRLQGKGLMREGFDADLTLIDLKQDWTIEENWLESKCGWSPFTGMEISGRPMGTIVRGNRVMWEAEIIAPAIGEPIKFDLS